MKPRFDEGRVALASRLYTIPFDARGRERMKDHLPFLTGWGELRSGTVQLFEEIDLELLLCTLDDPTISPRPDAISPSTNLLCLLNVPAFLIPGDILKFFGAYVDSMRSFKVLRHYSSPEIYLAVLEMVSVEAASCIIRDFHGQPLTSLEPAMCVLYPVRSILYDESLPAEEASAAAAEAETAAHGASAAEAAAQAVSAKDRQHAWSSSSLMTDNCPLCLDRLSESSCFTTCCNHSFHIQCISRLEGPQCPVCRFQHDSTSEELSACGICGCQGDDLWVCLVCGFVGCGRTQGFHIKDHYLDYLHTYAMNVNNRCVWDFAGNGYVHRLILQRPDNEADDEPGSFHNSSLSLSAGGGAGGSSSPGRGRSSTMSSSSSSTMSSSSSSSSSGGGSLSALTSSMLGDSSASRSARSSSFSALESLTGNPNASRSGTSSSRMTSQMRSEGERKEGEGRGRFAAGGGASAGGMKLMEIPDPSHTSPTRLQGSSAPLSSQQEELLINSKLEIAANHYNQLVTWQLQQHRERYEARLSRIQEHALQEAAAVTTIMARGQSGARAAKVEETWAQKVLLSLVVEKAKIIKQCDAGKERLRLAQEELDVLSKLNSSLTSNLCEWQQRVDAALLTLTTAEQEYRQGVPKLEKRVKELMKRLEESKPDSGSTLPLPLPLPLSSPSSSSSSSAPQESAGGDDS